MIDLHVHSNVSDGTDTPSELVHLAKQIGLRAFALTDHDTVLGLDEAMPVAEDLGIELVSGIELSTDYEGNEIHILGYYIDANHPEFRRQLEANLTSRDKKNEKMAELLREEGFAITIEAMKAENPGSILTRAHFAKYLVEHGMVKDRETVFAKYIGDDCRCYVPREKLTPFEAIRLIRMSGGLAFFAHPMLCHMNFERMKRFVGELKEAGLSGIEAIYSTATPGDERNFKELAKKYDLLISGGSDYHGANKSHLKLGVGRGNLYVPDDILEKIKKAKQLACQ